MDIENDYSDHIVGDGGVAEEGATEIIVRNGRDVFGGLLFTTHLIEPFGTFYKLTPGRHELFALAIIINVLLIQVAVLTKPFGTEFVISICDVPAVIAVFELAASACTTNSQLQQVHYIVDNIRTYVWLGLFFVLPFHQLSALLSVSEIANFLFDPDHFAPTLITTLLVTIPCER